MEPSVSGFCKMAACFKAGVTLKGLRGSANTVDVEEFCVLDAKVLLRRKFLFLFPSFFNINLLYMFKIIQIARNWNDTCVRELEISH